MKADERLERAGAFYNDADRDVAIDKLMADFAASECARERERVDTLIKSAWKVVNAFTDGRDAVDEVADLFNVLKGIWQLEAEDGE